MADIPSVVVQLTDREARLIEISENLHRSDLTALERSLQTAEWIELTMEGDEGVSSQVETNPLGGRPEAGVNAASRELGINRNDAHRAMQVAQLTPEARTAAVETGLDRNQSALLAAAQRPAEEQVEAIRQIREAGSVSAFRERRDTRREVADDVARRLAETVRRDEWPWLRESLYGCGIRCKTITTSAGDTAAILLLRCLPHLRNRRLLHSALDRNLSAPQ